MHSFLYKTQIDEQFNGLVLNHEHGVGHDNATLLTHHLYESTLFQWALTKCYKVHLDVSKLLQWCEVMKESPKLCF